MLDDIHGSAAPAIDEARRSALERARGGELLTGGDLREIFRIGRTRFWELSKAGDFEKFKVKGNTGAACYSGILVTEFLAGADVQVEPRVFGGSRRRR